MERQLVMFLCVSTGSGCVLLNVRGFATEDVRVRHHGSARRSRRSPSRRHCCFRLARTTAGCARLQIPAHACQRPPSGRRSAGTTVTWSSEPPRNNPAASGWPRRTPKMRLYVVGIRDRLTSQSQNHVSQEQAGTGGRPEGSMLRTIRPSRPSGRRTGCRPTPRYPRRTYRAKAVRR